MLHPYSLYKIILLSFADLMLVLFLQRIPSLTGDAVPLPPIRGSIVNPAELATLKPNDKINCLHQPQNEPLLLHLKPQLKRNMVVRENIQRHAPSRGGILHHWYIPPTKKTRDWKTVNHMMLRITVSTYGKRMRKNMIETKDCVG